MTVKELKEQLNQFPDHLIVMMPNRYWDDPCQKYDVVAKSVSRGINEFDGGLFIDVYEEDDE